jgi:hypothetical protein
MTRSLPPCPEFFWQRSCGDSVWQAAVAPVRARPAVISAPLNAQKFSELLMIVEPEISLCRREAAGGDLLGALLNRANAKCGCGHERHCDSKRDSDRLLDGWHDRLRLTDQMPTSSYY